MYRTNAKSEVHVVEVKPKNYFYHLRNQFWAFLFSLTNWRWIKEKMIKSILSGLPESASYCVDCEKKDCICGDEVDGSC